MNETEKRLFEGALVEGINGNIFYREASIAILRATARQCGNPNKGILAVFEAPDNSAYVVSALGADYVAIWKALQSTKE